MQRERSSEEVHRGRNVRTIVRTRAGSLESPAGTPRERCVRHAELSPISRGLLEVVPDDLVQFDEVGTVLVEPVREALVQVGSFGLRQRLVGGVADQEMPEAEAVLARELRTVGAHQLAADQRGEVPRDVRFLGCQGGHRPEVEDLSFDGAAFEHTPLGRVELVEPCREERVEVRRHFDVAVAVCRPREELLDEEWVAAGRAQDPCLGLT